MKKLTILTLLFTATTLFAETTSIGNVSPPNDPDFIRQYHHELIQTLRAWALLEGHQMITISVGIIDSGIEGDHPDLKNKLGDKHGAFGNDDPLQDGATGHTAGHGTQIAGIIGAEHNNTIGGAGIAQNVNLVSFRELATNRRLSISAGMKFMIEHEIPVVNVSLGVTNDQFGSVLMPEQFPGLIVFAGGNTNRDHAWGPEGHGIKNLITVGASDANDNRWASSDFCRYGMDIFAPGHHIFTTHTQGGYRSVSGTSFAAPMVAATAAMMLSVNPYLTAYELRTMIMATADILPQLSNYTVTGRLNAYRAVKAAIEALDRTEFNVTFNLTGGSYSGDQNLLAQIVTKGKNATALTANPTRNGFEFKGWVPAINLANINGSRMFTAQWQQEGLMIDCEPYFFGDWINRGHNVFPIGTIVAHAGMFWRAMRERGKAPYSFATNSGNMGIPGSAMSVALGLWEEVVCYAE